jgi:hypothetical protein
VAKIVMVSLARVQCAKEKGKTREMKYWAYSHQTQNWTILTRIIWRDKEYIQNSGVDIVWKLSFGRLRKSLEDNFMAVLWEKGSEDCAC